VTIGRVDFSVQQIFLRTPLFWTVSEYATGVSLIPDIIVSLKGVLRSLMPLNPTREYARECYIEEWMTTIIRDGGVVRMDDLHVDNIDEAWKPRECWVQSGLEAFRIALMLRDRHHLPFTVALGFSLKSGAHFKDVDFQNRVELVEKLNWVPPSLYLFEPGKTPRTNIGDVFIRELRPDFFGGTVQPVSCYYIEFRQPQASEYNRSVLLEG
jgi:hypothetical protein